MTESGAPNRGTRGLTELVVIVLGVMIALAADRWFAGIEERADAGSGRPAVLHAAV